MVVFYKKKWRKYNEIELTKNKTDLTNRKMKNHPPSPVHHKMDNHPIITLIPQMNSENNHQVLQLL